MNETDTVTLSRPAPHIPGEPGLWVMIFGDLFVFSALFVAYVMAFVADRPLFLSSQAELERDMGLLNTMLMLTSSWSAAQAVRLAKSGRAQVRPFVLGTIVLGACFVVAKIFEWSWHLQAGHTLNSNSFFTFYFMYTGIHLSHVVIGIGIMTWVYFSYSPEGRTAKSTAVIEGSAVFWHLVDLIWIIMFALLYLMH